MCGGKSLVPVLRMNLSYKLLTAVYVTVLGILAFVWLKIEWQSLFMSV